MLGEYRSQSSFLGCPLLVWHALHKNVLFVFIVLSASASHAHIFFLVVRKIKVEAVISNDFIENVLVVNRHLGFVRRNGISTVESLDACFEFKCAIVLRLLLNQQVWLPVIFVGFNVPTCLLWFNFNQFYFLEVRRNRRWYLLLHCSVCELKVDVPHLLVISFFVQLRISFLTLNINSLTLHFFNLCC